MSEQGSARSGVRARLQSIDPYQFEHFVGDLWEREGWNTTVSQASNDLGIDVVAEKKGTIDQKLVIQAKRYSEDNKVGRPEVQQYYSLRDQENADAAVVVTTGDFASTAENWAAEHNVKLVDGDDLSEMIARNDAGDLLRKYEGTDVDEESAFSSTAPLSSESSTSSTASTSDLFRELRQFAGQKSYLAVTLLVALQAVGTLTLFMPTAIPAITGDMPVYLLTLGWIFIGPAVFVDKRRASGGGLIWPAIYAMAFWMVPMLAVLLFPVYVSKR